MRLDPRTYLDKLSICADEEIDVGLGALTLAACMADPELLIERYEHHLKKLAEDVTARHADLLRAGAQDDVQTRCAALKHVLSDQYGYVHDPRAHQDIQSADLIRTIDRACGGGVVLGILYMHAARAQGWAIHGLDIAGHFACRLDQGGQRLIFNPAESCKNLEAPDLRLLVKQTLGPHGELSAQYYEPLSNRQILVALQNHIKFKQIEFEDYEGALKSVELLIAVAPEEFRLLLEAGVLYARTGQPGPAIEALERYITQAPYGRDRREALLLLSELKPL